MTRGPGVSSADIEADPDATVDELRRWSRRRLREAPGADLEPREATTLLGLALGWSDAQVYSRGDQLPTADQRRRFVDLVKRRLVGEPFAYLRGRREFYGRDFEVDPRVLIPRPETEHLVEACLELDPTPTRILDVGTGSGCIALTLALELPAATVLACDLSLGALAVARRNLERAAQEDATIRQRVLLFASDLLTAVDPRGTGIDTVVSNPPYIARGERLPPTVEDHEPGMALFSGPDGTEVYRRILEAVETRTDIHRVLFELGANQGPGVASLARERGLQVAGSVTDLAGWERVFSLVRREARGL